MTSSECQRPLERITELIDAVRAKGVSLWSSAGQLHYKAPKGALTAAEIETLRNWKSQIVAQLEDIVGDSPSEARIEPRPTFERAPLTFSQLAHWRTSRLYERKPIRDVTSAMRLHGKLDHDALRRSVEEIVRRHDALRTRIVVRDGMPEQQIAASGECEIENYDLTKYSESSLESHVNRHLEQFLLAPIDFATDCLLGIRLLKLREDEHVLIVAMEHMIADGTSRGILWRELFTAYLQVLRGERVSLPPIPIQFADYAVWQQSMHGAWKQKSGVYWKQRLAGCRRLRFPADHALPLSAAPGWGWVPVRMGKVLKTQLREWARAQQTTLAMTVFTAYVALVLRWCDVSEAVFRYQTDGRIVPGVENAIGFFASVLHLRIELQEGESFVELLRRVTHEHCGAYEHFDACYVESQIPVCDYTRNGRFNWLPQGSKSYSATQAAAEFSYSPLRFTHPMLKTYDLDYEPGIVLHDIDEEVVGGAYFPLHRFSSETMERFARTFMIIVNELLREPHACVKDVRIC